MPNPNLPINAKYNTYIGARYVPLMGGEWNIDNSYEPLVVVTYQGSSYTSNTFVPAGTDINNTTYWTKTGDYNAQVEQYRQEVKELQQQVGTDNVNLQEQINELQGTVNENQTGNTEAIQGVKTDIQNINEVLQEADASVKQIQSTIATITPITFGTPNVSEMDVKLYTGGLYTTDRPFGNPDNRTINMTDPITPLEAHKNICLCIAPDQALSVNAYIDKLRNNYPGFINSRFIVFIAPPTDFNSYLSYIANNRTITNSFHPSFDYMYELFPMYQQWGMYPTNMDYLIESHIYNHLYNHVTDTLLHFATQFTTQKMGSYSLYQAVSPYFSYTLLGNVSMENVTQITPVNQKYSEEITIEGNNFYSGINTGCKYLLNVSSSSERYLVSLNLTVRSNTKLALDILFPNNNPVSITSLVTGIPSTSAHIWEASRSISGIPNLEPEFIFS